MSILQEKENVILQWELEGCVSLELRDRTDHQEHHCCSSCDSHNFTAQFNQSSLVHQQRLQCSLEQFIVKVNVVQNQTTVATNYVNCKLGPTELKINFKLLGNKSILFKEQKINSSKTHEKNKRSTGAKIYLASCQIVVAKWI